MHRREVIAVGMDILVGGIAMTVLLCYCALMSSDV